MQGTDSTGAALLLWLAGIIYCLCGTHVYIEYGLNVPRYSINRVEQSVPRSGGDLNYLQYVYRKPAYRPGTIQLSTCLFGVGFIAFGNMAGNAINFANTAMRASGIQGPNNTAVRLIAIAVATLTCFIHAFSRRGGILLNNLFAIVKLSILLLIVIIAIVVGAGGLDTRNVLSDNTNSSVAFETEKNDVNGYAHAFLAVIFSFWGFEQPNYILGEIDRPRRKFPIAMTIGVVLICMLYMAVTISYVSLPSVNDP
jgi:amino acid transporter